MSDFGYVNARLRSLRAERIPARQFEAFASMERLEELGDWMASSPYAEAYGRASGELQGLKAIDRAISQKLTERLGRCLEMASLEGDSLLSVYLARVSYDNIKVAASAVVNETGYEGAAPALVPMAPLEQGALQEACGQPDLTGLADFLMTLGHPAGKAIRQFLRAEPDPAEPRLEVLDRRLEETYLQEAVKGLDDVEEDLGDALSGAILDEGDLANLRAALKLAYGGGGSYDQQPVTPTRLRAPFLEKVAACRNLSEALELVSKTVYRKALDEGASEAARSGDLGNLERCFERVRIQRLCRGAIVDPIGIRFTLRYLTEAKLEAQNLRLAARAAAGLIPHEAAQEAMIHV